MADSLDSILDDVVGPVNAQGQQASLPPLPVTAPQADTLDAILDEVAGPANPNAATPIRVQQALSAAEDTKPEEEARRNQLAKELGTSPALLPSIPEAEAELRRKKLPIEAARLANESPKTSAWSLVPGNAKIAGETGLAALAALEKEFPTLGYLDKALRSGIALGSAAASKLAEQALSFIYTPEEEIATLAKSKGELERLRALPGAAVGQYARREQARSEAILQTLTPEEKAGHMGKEYFTLDQEKAAYRDPVKMLGDLLQSAPSSAMAAVTVMLTRGAAIAARTEALATGASEQAATQAAIIAAGKTAAAVGGWSEGLITYGQGSLSAASEVEKMALDKIAKSPEFQRYIQLGYDPEVARTLLADKTGELSGAAGGALTGLISAVGGKYLGKIIGENGSWYGRLGKGALLGSTEEGLQSYQEQVAENIAIRKYAEPGREITQGAAEAGAQGAFLGALMEGPMTAASRAQQSVSTRDALNKIALDAASNPIREHSPEPYRNFIDTLTEGRSIREVFIDTDKVREVFEQAGVTERELNKVFPDIAAQLDDGANTDGFVRASTSDLVTKIKTPEILKSILDHARVQEDSGGMSMSFAEAEKFFQTQHEEFTKESVKAAETKARREQHEADMREIRQKIATEIFSSGRYDATVAKTHAVPLAAFYEKQAALFGGTVTAKELYEQYPYQAQSEQGKNEKINYLAEAMDVPSAKGPATKAFTARAVSETKPEVTKQLMRDDKGNYVWHEYQKAQAKKITTPEGRVLTPARFASESDLQAAVKANPLIIKRPPLKPGGKRGKGAFKQTSEGLPPNAEFDPSTLITTFLKDANLSSIIHESGHFYLEVLERLANRPDAPQAIKDDFNLFLNWFGVTPEQWAGMNIEERTPYHEQFAQSQELWMLEGKSPTLAPKMETAFARFRSWMLSVYKSVEQFLRQHPSAGKLNDEVRAAFSRLIASEEAIIEAEKTRGYVPLFATAEEAGMAPEAFNEYLMQNEEATQHAIGTAQKASMRDLKWLSNAKSKSLKKIQAQADGFRNAIREEVTAQVMDEPINRAREFLRKGVMVDPVTGEQQQADKFKLNIADLEAMADDPHLKGMTVKDGLHPDVVAMQFGYPSGDALLFDLVKAENAQEKIAGLVDQRMLQEHGEMVDARAIDNMVNAAVVNEARARFLATGLKILTKTGAPISQITKAAKLAAEEKIAKIPVKFLRPAQYAAAERRANAAALENAGKDPAAAIRAQRTAIFNNQMYRAALDAQEEFRIGAERAIRATKPAAQKAMGGEHLLQLNALLDRFGIRSKTTLLTETAPRKTLADYAEGEQRQGLSSYLATEAARLSAVSVDIPAWITAEQLSQDYESLTLTQFRELMDAVRAIEILARREREDYMSIRGQTFAEAKAANIARLRQVHPHLFNADGTLKPRAKKQVVTVGRTLDAKVDALHAELYSFETIVNVLEGGELGPLHESLTARMSARQDWKLGRMEQIFKTVEPLFEQYSKLERRAFTRKDIGMETLGFEMTRQGAVMVALYHGSAEGRNRLMNHGWNLETQRKIIDLLEPRDLNVVNGVFKIFDESLWPELSALDERTKGKAAPKVEAVPYTTRSGNVIGGYFKLKYDSAISTSPQNGVEAVNQLMGRTPGGRVTTAQGASVAREETVGENKRPRLDFNVFFETVNEIVNDLAYREAVADTQRMLLDPEMELIIKAASSEEEYNTLVHRIGGVVLGNQEPITFVEKMSSTIRKNTVVVLMSGVYTAMQNYLNFISVSHRVGKANLAVEILRMHGPTGPEAYRFAVKSSEYLRLRHLSYDRSLQENSKKLTVDEPLMPQMSTWLWLIGATDKIVSTVTWNTAYKEGMVKYANDTKQSVEYADHIVRQTLGSGRDFDISRMQEGALRQLLVMFYSFQNSQLQMQMRNATLAKREWNAGGKVKAMSMGLGALLSIVIMPAIFNDIAISMLRGDPRDDDEDLVTRAYHDVALYQMSFIPGLRDVGSFYFREVAGMSSYGFKLSPIESTITGVGKGAKSAAKMWEGESDPKLTGDAIMGLSYTLGLPGLMVKNAVVGAGAWVDNTAGPEAILFGPPKEVRH